MPSIRRMQMWANVKEKVTWQLERCTFCSRKFTIAPISVRIMSICFRMINAVGFLWVSPRKDL